MVWFYTNTAIRVQKKSLVFALPLRRACCAQNTSIFKAVNAMEGVFGGFRNGSECGKVVTEIRIICRTQLLHLLSTAIIYADQLLLC